jgi:hypothetical protein
MLAEAGLQRPSRLGQPVGLLTIADDTTDNALARRCGYVFGLVHPSAMADTGQRGAAERGRRGTRKPTLLLRTILLRFLGSDVSTCSGFVDGA